MLESTPLLTDNTADVKIHTFDRSEDNIAVRSDFRPIPSLKNRQSIQFNKSSIHKKESRYVIFHLEYVNE